MLEKIKKLNGHIPRWYSNISDAILEGIDLLDGPKNQDKGGVMILLTDRLSTANVDERFLLNKIRNQHIRIVTLAVGDHAAYKLEELAAFTQGKSFSIRHNDKGVLGHLHALEGASTFQPNAPIHEKTNVIKVVKFRNATKIKTSFHIDNTIGKNVEIFFFVKSEVSKLEMLTIVFPNGHKHKEMVNGQVTKVSFDNLEEGRYHVRAIYENKMVAVTAADIRVTSKGKHDRSTPIWTQCKVNVVGEVDPNKQVVKLMATVKKGAKPVLGAKIK